MKELVELLVEKGYIRLVPHKELPLTLINYTPTAQYESAWNEFPEVKYMRGMVINSDYERVNFPFPKFFNFEEHSLDEYPTSGTLTISNKMDGSLFIVFKYKGNLVFLTRGSFYSDHAFAASKIFLEKYSEDMIEEGKTYLFEYVSPIHKIVIKYDEPDIILLAILDSQSGADYPLDERFKINPVNTLAKDSFNDIFDLCLALKRRDLKNEEGYVLRVDFGDNKPSWRCKVKFNNYIELHRIVTQLSNKDIWTFLSEGKEFESLLEHCPDEFNAWVRKTKSDFESDYEKLYSSMVSAYEEASKINNRKDQYLFLSSNFSADVTAGALKLLDGKDIKSLIWKFIKPKKSITPFAMFGEN